jgi:hypothetical protein
MANGGVGEEPPDPPPLQERRVGLRVNPAPKQPFELSFQQATQSTRSKRRRQASPEPVNGSNPPASHVTAKLGSNPASSGLTEKLYLIIRELQDDVKQLRKELQAERDANVERTAALVQQIGTVAKSLPPASWAATAAKPPTPPVSPSPALASSASRPYPSSHAESPKSPWTDPTLATLTVECKCATDVSSDPATARAFFRERLPGHVEIRAFALTARDKRLIKIKVAQGEERTLRDNTAWLPANARLLQQQWYDVRLDHVFKPSLCSDTHTISPTAADAFGNENGVSVQKIRYLRRQRPEDEGKSRTSFVVSLGSQADASKLLNAQEVTVGGQTVFAKEYIRVPIPMRCYCCQQYGHIKERCSTSERCVNCSQSHPEEDCIMPDSKCANCGRAHRADSPKCPTFLAEKAKLLARNE